MTMRLTLQGLQRALRLKAHEMADEIEAGYRRPRPSRTEDVSTGVELTRRGVDDGVGGD
ncbi:hypothetical protein [Mesorhizobium sp. CAU 1732]|uniref:hypothetical protein n=1 Tax=Mesorhizobium sp. CAU 1732 TaxID=3140358 RepID=UPI0032609F5D